MREIETAADGVHRNPIDLHQIEIVIAPADEHAGHAARAAGLADGDPRQVTKQIHGQTFVAFRDLLPRHDA